MPDRVRSPATLATVIALAMALGLGLVASTASARPPAGTASSPDAAAAQPAFAPGAEFSDSSGVQAVGHLPTPGGFNADVTAHGRYAYLASWGAWQPRPDASGEFPFCPSQGVRVVDLVDPRTPRLATSFADAASEPDVAGSWTEKVVVSDVDTSAFSGTMAVVSFQNCRPDGFRGFGVYDVTDPTKPERLHLEQTEQPGETDGQSGSHEIWLDTTDDGRAFVYTAELNRELRTAEGVEIGDDGAVAAGEPTGEADFRIFEVTDPTAVAQVGQWGAWDKLGVPPLRRDGNGVLRSNFVHSVVTGTNADGRERAYLSYWDLGTVVLDISDRSEPTMVGRTEFGADEAGDAHSALPIEDGQRLIQTEETFVPAFPEEGQGPDPNNVLERAFGYGRLFDVRDESAPREVARFELDSTRADPQELPPGFHTIHNPAMRPGDEQVYFSWYAEGAVVMPLPRDPATLTVIDEPIAQFVPPPTEDPRGFFFPGHEHPNVFGVAPHEDHAGRPYALASDVNSGLWVFRLADEVPAGSCPAGQVSEAQFSDVAGDNAHHEAISCAVHAGIAQGVSEEPPRFAPGRAVSRGQMASFIARTLRSAGLTLPEGDAAFTDTDGSVHEPAIDALAEAGIVAGVSEERFAPQASVRRDQVATFLIRAVEFAVGEHVGPVGDGSFEDVREGVHADNVNAAAEFGLVLGTGTGEFKPASQTRRDQMTSLVTRGLDQLEFVVADR